MLIGLTGGYCAGKNTVAALLERRGFLCLDVDRLGHEALATAEAAVAVRARFGDGALGADGSVDRRALAASAFGDKTALADLEAIVHPIVYGLMRERFWPEIEAGRDACINAALLYRMPDAARCDLIVEVRAPLCVRLARARRRDGASPAKAMERIAAQRSFWKARSLYADRLAVVRNGGSEGGLEAALDRALARLTAHSR